MTSFFQSRFFFPVTTLLVAGTCLSVVGLRAESPLPQPLTGDTFAALINHSPFNRSVDVSKSIVITGIAHIGEEVFATLLNLETGESQVASQTQRSTGWQLIEIKGEATDLESLTAQVKSASGELVRVRYEKNPPRPKNKEVPSSGKSLSTEQLSVVKKAADNYREGFSGDGFPNPPPPEIVAKLSKLSPEQRAGLARHTLELRNKGVPSEERRKIYTELLDRAASQNAEKK